MYVYIYLYVECYVCVCVCVCVCVMVYYLAKKKEGNSAICNNIDGPQGHYGK